MASPKTQEEPPHTPAMSSDTTSTQNDLSKLQRIITTHDTTGKSVFSKSLADDAKFFDIPTGEALTPAFFLGYTTHSFPCPLTNDSDLQTYESVYEKSSSLGLVKVGGSILRYVDYPPAYQSPMHRTVSLDYGIVLDGEIDCVLDSGETKKMVKGDCAIQRGTMHAWRNRSSTHWARMVYILLDATPVVVNGKSLGEELTDIKGVPDSH